MKNIKRHLKNFFVGIILGVANIIPGVSGGTMAVVTGVYAELIGIFTLDFKHIKKNIGFVIFAIIGIVVGIFAFSGVIKFLLENYVMATSSFFIGVIAGTCPFIYRRAIAKGSHKLSAILPCFITFFIMLVLTIMENTFNPEGAETIYTTLNVQSFLILFGTMILTSACMIIPGISGSFIALALGVYPSIIRALSEFNLPLILPIFLGMIAGLIGGAKLIRWLLSKAPTATYSAILGLLFGSILSLAYPLVPTVRLDLQFLIAIIMFTLGVAMAIFFARADKRRERRAENQ